MINFFIRYVFLSHKYSFGALSFSPFFFGNNFNFKFIGGWKYADRERFYQKTFEEKMNALVASELFQKLNGLIKTRICSSLKPDIGTTWFIEN